MDGFSHVWVAAQASKCISDEYRVFIQDEWDWLEGAVTLPDARLRYDTSDSDALEPDFRKLFPVHCFDCDSAVPHEYGLVGQAWRYFEGPLAFVRDCRSDAFDDPDYYFGQLAFYLGMLCHYVADLCTPVHTGFSFDRELVEFWGRRFHQRLEARMHRLTRFMGGRPLGLTQPRAIDREYFLGIARDFAYPIYRKLPSLSADLVALDEQLSMVLVRAVSETATVWVSLLSAGEFMPRKKCT